MAGPFSASTTVRPSGASAPPQTECRPWKLRRRSPVVTSHRQAPSSVTASNDAPSGANVRLRIRLHSTNRCEPSRATASAGSPFASSRPPPLAAVRELIRPTGAMSPHPHIGPPISNATHKKEGLFIYWTPRFHGRSCKGLLGPISYKGSVPRIINSLRPASWVPLSAAAGERPRRSSSRGGR